MAAPVFNLKVFWVYDIVRSNVTIISVINTSAHMIYVDSLLGWPAAYRGGIGENTAARVHSGNRAKVATKRFEQHNYHV